MSRKKTNKVKFELQTEGGEIAQVPNNKKKPFKIKRGGIAKPLGNGFYYLQGKSHEDGGIDMTFNTDARIFSSVPFLNGKSPAERVMRDENPDTIFAWQEEFKDVNGINDDGSRKKAKNGKEVKAVPTREEYITSKIDSTINAALNKSRTRKEGIAPILYTINNSDPDIRKKNVESALNRAETFQREALLEADMGNMDIARRYRQYAINEYELAEKQLTNCSIDSIYGPGCIYTATDNYGKQYRVSGNRTFAANPNKYGFVKINTKDRQPGDLQQHLAGNPIHMMIFNGYDEKGKPRYNYSSGEPMKVNANYPINEEDGHRIDTFRFVGTPADSVKWTNEYNELYMNNNNKKRLGGSTGLIRVQANGKDKLMYVPFTGEETKADRKKARWGAYADDTTYDTLNEYLTERAKKYKDYSIIDPSKLTSNQKVDIDWMHDNLISTGVDAADRTDYLSSNKGTLFVGQKKTPLSEQRTSRQTAGMNYAKGYKIDADRFNPVIINPDEIKETKVPEVTDKQVRQQTRAALKKEGLDWVSRNKDWAAPAISALGNGLASLISYGINKNMLGDMTYSDRPIPKRANPLITRVNVEPKLTNLRENLARSIESTIANASDSRVSQSRINDMALNTTLAMNSIYADKENQERDLINQDRLNQQEVANANIDAYNNWRTGKTNFENTIREQLSENAVSLADNINKGIQTGITDAEKRRQFRNNLAIMAAAYPNVTPELLRTYGADFLRMGGKVKLNKKK